MKTSGAGVSSATLTLELEQSIVHGAIELVAAGVSDHVVCAGLHFAAQLVEPARTEGRRMGVAVTPLWSLDDLPTGIEVSKLDA